MKMMNMNYVKEFNKLYKFKNIKINLNFENFKKDFKKIVKYHDNQYLIYQFFLNGKFLKI